MTNKLLLSTPTDPKLLNNFLKSNKEVISKVTLVSLDFPPIEVLNKEVHSKHGSHISNQTVLNKKQDQAVMFDVVGIIIDVDAIQDNEKNVLEDNTQSNQTKKIFLISSEVIFIIQNDQKLVSINGNFSILPDELISKVYVNFSKLKSIDLDELEEFLELSKDETAIKAFYKLGSFFTAKKYEINNNIFNLVEHQEEAESVAKKVILKKMVAWEIRK